MKISFPEAYAEGMDFNNIDNLIDHCCKMWGVNMEKSFIQIRPEEINDNAFKAIGSDWMLITAGNINSYNTMTASWGGLGVLWNRNIAFCVVRDSRYTRKFIDNSNIFPLSFFDDKYKDALRFCGAHSGRDCDKAAETGLTAVESKNGSVFFNEARLVLECRKLYYHDIAPEGFVDSSIVAKIYNDNDYHRFYIGEIINCYKKD